MKLVKVISTMMVATTLGIVSTTVKPDMTAQAETIKSLTKIPKALRGTWYFYDGYNRYDHYKITSKKVKVPLVSGGYDTNTIHKFNLKKNSKSHDSLYNLDYGSAHNWMFAYKKGNKYIMEHWASYSTDEKSDFATYRVVKKNYKGKKVTGLQIHYYNSPKGSWSFYSPSKKVAKYLATH